MGFVRTIAPRQVFAHINGAVEARKRHADLMPCEDLAASANPEE